MSFTIRYARSFDRSSLKRFPKADRQRLASAILEKLVSKPHIFGKPLRRSWRGYWSLRIGMYRIVYRIEGDTVWIFDIGLRKNIY
ncbi:MAG: type II toxin-antitoxin system RelE/ParE family toxin [Candidatus Peribacteraceae bacterium]|nr:type II toxin-antitoxin system RelE/ParE family toxin [Candidatus Peribacteraceae bacterium]